MAYMAESGFTYGSEEQTSMEKNFREHMLKMLEKRPEILKTLLPDFPPGCRRLVSRVLSHVTLHVADEASRSLARAISKLLVS